MKLAIFGDSLAFPRRSQGQALEETWPYLLATRSGHSLFQRNQGGSTARQVLNEAQHVASYLYDSRTGEKTFDYSILQFGIVDCCPRPYPYVARRFLYPLPLFNAALRFVDKRYPAFLKLYSRPWTSRSQFQGILQRVLAETSRFSRVTVVVAIGRPCHYLLEKTGDFSTLTEDYNEILREVSASRPNVKFIDPYGSLDPVSMGRMFLPDGHHLSKEGHALIHQSVSSAIT